MHIQFLSKLVLPLFIATLIVSCVSEQTEHKILAVQKLQFQVDSSAQEFKKLNIEKIKDYKTNASSQLDYLKENFHDTNFQNAKYIDVYYRNYKLMTKLIKGHDRLQSEITYSTNQLNTLQHDIENGFLTDSLYQEYYDGEIKAVKKIINTSKTLMDWETKSVNRYNGMVTSIDSVVTHLQNQGYR